MFQKVNNFNTKLAAKITSGVSTMWCAYAFALIALISLPAALKTGDLIIIVAWVAQTFLQLVLLSIIMVGQNVSSAAVEQKINETHTASLGEFELAKESREQNQREIEELHKISKEIHDLVKKIEKSGGK
jgi:signal transduction histidine kinase